MDKTLLCHSRDTSSILVVAVYIFLGSSMAEQSAVNRVVVGSSPTWGAMQGLNCKKKDGCWNRKAVQRIRTVLT